MTQSLRSRNEQPLLLYIYLVWVDQRGSKDQVSPGRLQTMHYANEVFSFIRKIICKQKLRYKNANDVAD